MRFIQSDRTDPSWNLALEEYLVGQLPEGEQCLYLWRNDNTIVVGKNQNTLGQINMDCVRQRGIHVRRRLSGGGAVYHDLGNLNFTWIIDAPASGKIDYRPFCAPIIDAIESFGAHAILSGRNDILVDGKKISGNSQYYTAGKLVHHGTILFDTDLTVLTQALNVDKSKFEGKGIASVESRVTNLKPFLPPDVTLEHFAARLTASVAKGSPLVPIRLSSRDLESIAAGKKRYDSWQWNFGSSPPFSRREKIRIPNCGLVEVWCQVEGGIIQQIRFTGDFFGKCDVQGLEHHLKGCTGSRHALQKRLKQIQLDNYIQGLDAAILLDLLVME